MEPLPDAWPGDRAKPANESLPVVWPTFLQTTEALVEGLDASWLLFGGVVRRVVLDNSFVEAQRNVVVLGPVGVDKPSSPTCLVTSLVTPASTSCFTVVTTCGDSCDRAGSTTRARY